jgi:ABC-type nickel/cobalt efflux system permease component RcnA
MRLTRGGRFAVVLLVACCAACVAWAQARTPFGVAPAESAPSPGGGPVAAWILAKQAEFYRLMTRAVIALRTDGAAVWTLVTLAFFYGVFHAAGPGHGKAVISAYIVASERALKRGILIAGLAALLQALMAVLVVAAVVQVAGATGRAVTATVHWVEIAAFAALAGFGAWLAWRKGRNLALAFGYGPPAACDHFHMPPPGEALRMNWREAAGVVLAAGLRPCAGAVIVLMFALAQQLYWAGIAAVLAMSAGTAVTTAAVASLAVFMKGAALRLASGRSSYARIVSALEFLAALAVLLLGLMLLYGYLAGAMPRGS